MTFLRPFLLVVAVALVPGACGTSSERAEDARATTTTTPRTTVSRDSSLARRITALPPARYDERDHRARNRAPVALTIDDLAVRDVSVVAVGIRPDGDMEVPAPSEVGWYRFGPAPGAPGTTVLAAHIAYGGVDGVFRHLDELEPGDAVVVTQATGTKVRYRVESLAQYGKRELPADIWARSGEERLALITCGGTFNASLRSYESNVVAWAVPEVPGR